MASYSTAMYLHDILEPKSISVKAQARCVCLSYLALSSTHKENPESLQISIINLREAAKILDGQYIVRHLFFF